MDLLASRLAETTKVKAKPLKKVKKAKDNLEGNSPKSVSKVNSREIVKPSKKQKLGKVISSIKQSKQQDESSKSNLKGIKKQNKNLTEKISSQKKQRIVDTFIDSKNKSADKLVKVVRDISKKKKKNKSLEKSPVEEVIKKKKKSLAKSQVEKVPKKKKKSVVKSLLKPVKSDSVPPIVKKISKKHVKNEDVSENVISQKKKKKCKSGEAANVTENTIDGSVKSSALKIKKFKDTCSQDVRSKKRKVLKDEDLSKAKMPKKQKAESLKSLEVDSNKEIKSIKSKKRKTLTKQKAPENQIGPVLNRKIIRTCVKGLLKVVENQEQRRKSLFNSELPSIFLLINCVKIPKAPLHQKRM